MVHLATWKGTHAEFVELRHAADQNCRALQLDKNGVALSCGTLCLPHRMLSDDRVLSLLLCARRNSERLCDEEWHRVKWRSEYLPPAP